MLNKHVTSEEKSANQLLGEEFFPERIVNSKILKIVKDDLSFKISELKTLSDIPQSKDAKSVLNASDYIMLDPLDKDTAHITFPECFFKVTVSSKDKSDEEALKHIGLSIREVKRINQEGSNWVIVVENSEFADKLNKLKQEDKVELAEIKDLKKILNLKLMDIRYSKETSGLKAKTGSGEKKVPNWRKKSDDSSTFDNGRGGFKRGLKFKRERFNSDGRDCDWLSRQLQRLR